MQIRRGGKSDDAGGALTVAEPLALLVLARQWGPHRTQNFRGRDCTTIGRQYVAVLRLGELAGAGSGRGMSAVALGLGGSTPKRRPGYLRRSSC